MELNVTTDLATALPAEIVFNFEELKAELEERLEYYNRIVITEDTIKEGKADRAKLNKLLTAIDTRRKDIKKACMAPYNAFEAKIKELTALISAPIAAIDGQLATYEEQRIEEKRQQIAEAYAAIVPEEIRDIIPMESIFNPGWLNATTSMKAVEADLQERVKRTNADMMALNVVEPEYALAVREVYIRTLDIEKAMQHRTALQKADEAFVHTPQANSQPKEPVAPVKPQEPQSKPDETVYRLRLEMQLTMAQADALKRFLEDNHITYTKI